MRPFSPSRTPPNPRPALREKVQAVSSAKPTAATIIEPMGRRNKVPRDHLVTVRLDLSAIDARHADKAEVTAIARRALGEVQSPSDGANRGKLGEAPARPGFGAIAVEGTLLVGGRPGEASIDHLRTLLGAEGFRVTVRERRECSQPGCATDALSDWNQAGVVPAGWYTGTVCGKHNFKTCPGCSSIYQMTSTNSVGQAPSVACQVCGTLLVSWGGSKNWSVVLVEQPVAPPTAG